MASSNFASGDDSMQFALYVAYTGNLNLLKGLAAEFGGEREEQAKGLMGAKDPHGRTVLHKAASGGRTNVCNYLIEKLKIDVNVQDDQGLTPLHCAVLDGHYLTCVYLLNHGAQPNAATHQGITPLHCAARNGRQDQLRLLISKGVDMEAQSIKGTPLHCAAAHGMKNAVKILLANGANPNSVHQRFTPLLLAVSANSFNCVRLLLEGGADPNLGNVGVTPLTMAVHTGQTEMIKCLLKAKADPNAPHFDGACGTAPLIMAASVGQTEIIKCLLKAGADPNLTNFFDLKPIEIAAMHGSRADVMELFQATNPIPSIKDWSVDGILKYGKSVEAENAGRAKMEGKFHEAKAKGADAVKRNSYLEAVYWYTIAISIKPEDATVYSNRSLCFARLNNGQNALEDAMACVALRPDWPKAYYRVGVAWGLLKDYEEAVEAFKLGLMIDPHNKDLQDAKRVAEASLEANPASDSTDGTFTDEDDSDFDELLSMMYWLNLFG